MQSLKTLSRRKHVLCNRKFYYIGIFILLFWILIIIILLIPRHLNFTEVGIISKHDKHYFITKNENLDPFNTTLITATYNHNNIKFIAKCKYIFKDDHNKTKKYAIINDRWLSAIYNFDKTFVNKSIKFIVSNSHYYLLITNFIYKFKR